MKPGEVQRELIRLGFNLEQAAYALGISYEHMRALHDGRSRVRENIAQELRTMTLLDASNLRLTWWRENGHAKRRSYPTVSREPA